MATPPIPHPQFLKPAPSKPKVTINIPQQYQDSTLPSPNAASIHSNAATTTGGGGGEVYVNPFNYMYSGGEYVFKQFEGIVLSSAKSGLNIGEKVAFYIYEKFSKWSRKWFTHIFLFIVIFLYSLAGAFIFVAVEGPPQQKAMLDIRMVKHNFTAQLYSLAKSKKLQDNFEEWEGAVDREMHHFIQSLTTIFKSGYFDEDQNIKKAPVWGFWNAVFYCGTIFTTIGYGHISPSTNTGRAITIVYAVFGIPMFLILLADFGKLFTRGIKFLWAYVRRLYYTGSCRRVRKQSQVQDVLKGVNFAYEIATFRRPSLMTTKNEKTDIEQPAEHQSADIASVAESPPIDDVEIVIDDEFNLPISLALFILLAYIFFGAAVYSLWEEWSFFESFYFVFISMSTIGFGDYVPKHPMYMMTSIVYLVFGLALTSMCINVVQLKLSDSFRHASAKIGATIGLTMAEEEAKNSQCHTPNDIKEQVEPNTSVDDTKPKEPAAVEPPPLLPRKPTKSVTEDTKANVKKQKGDKKK